jgi:hypothetical protein
VISGVLRALLQAGRDSARENGFDAAIDVTLGAVIAVAEGAHGGVVRRRYQYIQGFRSKVTGPLPEFWRDLARY